MIDYLPASARYSLDTSCLVNGWGKHYPPDMFAPVWAHVDGLLQRQLVVASSEVMNEIERQADDLHEWCCERPGAFVDLIDDIQSGVVAILRDYPAMTAADRNRADPFVIATALLDSGRITVVTEETGQRASLRKPKIPFVCAARGIRCIPFEMLRETGFRF